MTNSTEDSERERKRKLLSQIKEEIKKVKNYTPKVGILGDTGVGKSSLCNALFGKEIAAISDVEACTRKPQEILIASSDGAGIVLVDVPGIGEDPGRHKEYTNLYKSLVPGLDLIIWAIKADDRKYSSSIEVYNEVIKPWGDRYPVLFVITQADKIEPVREWDSSNNKPGERQSQNLISKINDIATRFGVSTKNIVAVSATESYNLKELVNHIVGILPNEKKSSFTRETKEENVSEEAAVQAEKGTWEYLKEKFGPALASVKDLLINDLSELMIAHGPKLYEVLKMAAIAWLKKVK